LDLPGLAHGRGRLKKDHQLGLVALGIAEMIEGVEKGRLGGSLVTADLRGTPDDLGPVLPGDGRDPLAVGGHNDAAHRTRLLGMLDGPDDQWLASDDPEILPQDAFGAPTGRYDDQAHAAIFFLRV
jgi:hypothetical protein